MLPPSGYHKITFCPPQATNPEHYAAKKHAGFVLLQVLFDTATSRASKNNSWNHVTPWNGVNLSCECPPLNSQRNVKPESEALAAINHWESYLLNMHLFDVLGRRGTRYVRFQQSRGE